MSEFDWGAPSEQPSGGSSTSGRGKKRGGWYVPLTLLGLVLVGGLSILMSWLTRDVTDRPIWMMGLIFMVPAGAMFFAAMLLEFSTGVMTPSMSRKPQVIVAVLATVLTFAVGCLCDAIYLYGGYVRNAGVNFVFAMDRGDTSDWPAYETGDVTRAQALDACASGLLLQMPAYTDVAYAGFGWDAVNTHGFVKATDEYKLNFDTQLAVRSDEGVSYVNMLTASADMADASGNGLPTRILLFTGGDEAVYLINDEGDVHDLIANDAGEYGRVLSNAQAREDVIDRLQQSSCTLYVISPDGQIADGLREVAEATGGVCVSISEASTVEEFVSIIKIDGDMLRAGSGAARILTLIMLLLEGIVIGVCISIMLSTSGQKRVQMILTPILALVSFAMVKLLGTPENNPVDLWWLWEGLSFLPLGLIFMRSNDFSASRPLPSDDGDFGEGSSSGFSTDSNSDFGW